jgi:hypothetical protein
MGGAEEEGDAEAEPGARNQCNAHADARSRCADNA